MTEIERDKIEEKIEDAEFSDQRLVQLDRRMARELFDDMREYQRDARRLGEELQAERDCVLRQQREINRLKQHIADTPAAVLS